MLKKKMVMAALVAVAASGLVGTAFTSSAQAASVHSSAQAIHTMLFWQGNASDNMRQCLAYGAAGQAAGKWFSWKCVSVEHGAAMFYGES